MLRRLLIWPREIYGFLLILFAIYLMPALATYTPQDLSSWTGINPHGSSSVAENMFGHIGAHVCWALLTPFGLAVWLIPALSLLFGVQILFRKFPRPSLGSALSAMGLLICASVMLSSQQFLADRWAIALKLPSAGGYIGEWIGPNLLCPMLGNAGSFGLFALIYLILCPLILHTSPLTLWNALLEEFSQWQIQRKPKETQTPQPVENKAPQTRQRKKPTPTTPLKTESDTPPAEPEIIDGSRNKRLPSPSELPSFKTTSEPTPDFSSYELPPLSLLHIPEIVDEPETDNSELIATQNTIIETLSSFGVSVAPGNITRGPTITRYEIYPSQGLRVGRITQLENDIARATKAESINILAPIPGRDTVGIEIANSKKVAVPLSELLVDPAFANQKKRIPIALGKDVYGNTIVGDLAAMPHLLVAGATGSGKSVCINSIISSILFRFRPDELRFILVDPKVVEMQSYSKLPHLIAPVVTAPEKVIGVLRWAVNEMEKRYSIFAKIGVRNFESYNNRPRPEKQTPSVNKTTSENDPDAEENSNDAESAEEKATSKPTPIPDKIPGSEEMSRNMSPDEEKLLDDFEAEMNSPEDLFDDEENSDSGDELINDVNSSDANDLPDRFPYIVIIIDELADLMQTAPADMESYIARITQKARAAGIHLIVATQTPRADVVTGIIKANIPCRIAFQVSSALDSRVILDSKGAEKLVGKGDLLYLPPGSAKLERAQGAFISDSEVDDLVAHCCQQAEQHFTASAQQAIENSNSELGEEMQISPADEEILSKCIDVILAEQKASTSLLQRRLRLGYNKAARMMDILEQRGYVSAADGAKPRDVLISDTKSLN